MYRKNAAAITKHRQHRVLTERDRDLDRREPQLALDHPARWVLERVDRIASRAIGPDGALRSRNHEIDPATHPLSDHGGRSLANTAAAVFRASDGCLAFCRCDNPPRSTCRINAQS
jgi:hypothetical protein